MGIPVKGIEYRISFRLGSIVQVDGNRPGIDVTIVSVLVGWEAKESN